MAARLRSRKDPGVRKAGLAKGREDKERESRDGFDGTWIAHPDLVPVAASVFEGVLGARPHQKEKIPDRPPATAPALTNLKISGGTITLTSAITAAASVPSPRPDAGPPPE